MSKKLDLTGHRFGRLLAIEPAKAPSGSTRSHWRCACDCGSYAVVDTANLRSGHSTSCGCLAREVAATKNKTHGMSKTKLFGIWWTMLNRCENPKVKRYSDYGGRGIAVCAEWHESSIFFAWALENGYKEGLSIDRRNNDGNYEPSNCRWVDLVAQANNTRKNHWVNVYGEKLTAKQAAEKYTVPYPRFVALINAGWSPEEAIKHQQELILDDKILRVHVLGETLTLSEAGSKYEIHPETIRARLKKGWDEETAVLTPRKHIGRQKRGVS